MNKLIENVKRQKRLNEGKSGQSTLTGSGLKRSHDLSCDGSLDKDTVVKSGSADVLCTSWKTLVEHNDIYVKDNGISAKAAYLHDYDNPLERSRGNNEDRLLRTHVHSIHISKTYGSRPNEDNPSSDVSLCDYKGRSTTAQCGNRDDDAKSEIPEEAIVTLNQPTQALCANLPDIVIDSAASARATHSRESHQAEHLTSSFAATHSTRKHSISSEEDVSLNASSTGNTPISSLQDDTIQGNDENPQVHVSKNSKESETVIRQSVFSGKTKKTLKPWEKPYDLPPCQVCGDKGTGFHYGANTCEACKGFFRRSLARQHELMCRQNAKCQLRPSKRSMCALCRFKKCLEIGMSVEAIKTGRYTAEKRRRDTLVVKKLETVQSEAADEPVCEPQSEPEPTSPGKVEDAVDEAAQRQNCVKTYDQLVNDIVESSRRHLPAWEECDNQLYTLHEQVMANTSAMEQGTATDQAGDEERVSLLNTLLALLEDIVKTGVKFIKAVPGFRELKMQDQIELFKAGLTDMRFVLGHKRYRRSSENHLVHVFGVEMADKVTRIISRLRTLELTDDESVILGAFVAFTTDRCNLQEPENVQAIHDELLAALRWLLSRSHPVNQGSVLAQVVGCLTELRSIQELSKNTVNQILEENINKGILKVPPIFWEMHSPT